ncbi:MAG: hypothetical protein KGL97_06560 [Alphaproteobacteria bacterium]|nr:hypothetical protein [Alphaproteobacteria bacterium]
MRVRSYLLLAACLFFASPAAARAQGNPWTATLYYGPSTTKFFVAAVESLKLQPTGTMIGLAADRRLAYLGWDISLAGEGQITQYFFGHTDTTVALGLGFQADDLFGYKRTSLNIYDGPSYATDPPYTSIGYKGRIWPSQRKKWQNFIGVEFAVGIPWDRHWDAVFRLYHRSGLFGVYNESDDDGLAFGAGMRCHF